VLTFQTGHFGRFLLLRVHAAGERQRWMSKDHKLRLEPYGPVLPVCPALPPWVSVANKRIGKRIFEITSRIGVRFLSGLKSGWSLGPTNFGTIDVLASTKRSAKNMTGALSYVEPYGLAVTMLYGLSRLRLGGNMSSMNVTSPKFTEVCERRMYC
jgi:hypothetical protein